MFNKLDACTQNGQIQVLAKAVEQQCKTENAKSPHYCLACNELGET